MVYAEVGGRGFKPTNDVRAIFKKDKLFILMGGKVAVEARYKIDSTKAPKTMDVTILKNKLIPESKGTTGWRIYRFDKDGRLQKCSYGAPFHWWRPTEFRTKEGSSGSIVTYQQVKR